MTAIRAAARNPISIGVVVITLVMTVDFIADMAVALVQVLT